MNSNKCYFLVQHLYFFFITGMVALHYAAWQGKMEPVHILVQWKSPCNEQAMGGETPLHLACQHGHFDVVSYNI